MTVAELFTVHGSASGTGDMSLTSDIFHGTATYIRIPKGMKLKIWARRVTGDATGTIVIRYTHDVTEATPTWVTLSTIYLSSAGEKDLTLSKRPIKVVGYTGKEAIKAEVTSGTGNYTLELDVEITDGE